MRLKKAVVKLLERERVCRVATVGPDGVPHVVPVCHVVLDGRIYFASDADARKVHNLRAHPEVAVTVDLYTEDWGRLVGILVQGRARVIDRGPEFRRVRRALYEKYPQYPEEAAIEEGESVVVEITPARLSSWGLE